MKTPLEVDGEHDAGLPDRLDRRAGGCRGERKGLFHADMLPRLRRALDVLFVHAVRRGVDDRVDLGVLENLIERIAQLDFPVPAEILCLGAGARVGGDEGDLVALALHALDNRLSPPAQADDRGSNHVPSFAIAIGIACIRPACASVEQIHPVVADRSRAPGSREIGEPVRPLVGRDPGDDLPGFRVQGHD